MNDGKFRLGLVKMSNGEAIPEDEPIFIFRGRDYLAVQILKLYKARSKVDGCNDYQINGVDAAIERFEKFAKENPNRMKQPGITRGT